MDNAVIEDDPLWRGYRTRLDIEPTRGMTMHATVVADLKDMEDRRINLRIADLSKHDVETLAEFASDLEEMNHAAKVRIEELEADNDRMRDKINTQSTRSGDLKSSVEYLSELLNSYDEDVRRAELVGREPLAGLLDEILRETSETLIPCTYAFIPEV